MKQLFLVILVPVLALGEELPFDLDQPGLLRPGNVYAFSIQPTPKSKPFTIRLHAEKETFAKDQAGEPYAAIAKVTATAPDGTVTELPFGQTDIGVPHTDVGDFDFDGDQDFRIIEGWGTGGSWYVYYRFKDGLYEHWEEPEELGLNHFDEKGKEAVSSGRSGPENSSTYFEFKNGHFSKVRVEAIRLKNSLPEFKDKEVGDWTSALVKEDWKDGKLIKRTVEPQQSQ